MIIITVQEAEALLSHFTYNYKTKNGCNPSRYEAKKYLDELMIDKGIKTNIPNLIENLVNINLAS